MTEVHTLWSIFPSTFREQPQWDIRADWFLGSCSSHIEGKAKINCQNSNNSARLWKKTFPRMSDKRRKHERRFQIGRGTNILPLDCFSSWFSPQRDCDPPALQLCFPLRARRQTYVGGHWPWCCVRRAVTLSDLWLLLLDVWSFLNVTAQTECDEQIENNFRTTQEKMSQRPAKVESSRLLWINRGARRKTHCREGLDGNVSGRQRNIMGYRVAIVCDFSIGHNSFRLLYSLTATYLLLLSLFWLTSYNLCFSLGFYTYLCTVTVNKVPWIRENVNSFWLLFFFSNTIGRHEMKRWSFSGLSFCFGTVDPGFICSLKKPPQGGALSASAS